MKSLLFSFEGRIGRKTWWLATLALVGALVALQVVVLALGMASEALAMLGMLVFLVFCIGAIWAGLAIQVKRWHDLGKSGWWVLINLVPVIGPLYALVMQGFVKGAEARNDYGDDPLAGLGATVPRPA